MAVTRTGKRCREIAVVLAVILTIVGDPGTPTAQGELATTHAAGGPPSAGTSRAQAAAIFRSAAALQNRELHDLAEAEWASLVEHFPNDLLVGKARYYRGICLVRLERYADAEAEFGRVVAEQAGLDATLIEQSFANLGLAQYRRARLAAGEEQAKAFDAAIATLGQQLERFPAGRFAAQAHFYRAEACYERQDVASALADYQAVVTEHGDPALRPRALYGLGVAQEELGNPAGAGQAFDVFLQEFPLDALAAEVHFRRGEWRAATGDEDGAVRDFQRISERWPESPFAPQALLRQSHLEQQGREFALAQATLGRFLVNYRDHESAFQARLLRATVRHEMGLYQESLLDSAELLDGQPTVASADRCEALLLRGMCEAKLNRLEDAVATFEAILEQNAEYHAADRVLYELAWAYQEYNEPKAAASTFLRLAKEHPRSPLAAECWLRVGESQFAAREFAAAVDSFEKASQLADDPSLKEKATHQLGWSHYSLDQFDKAERAFADQLAEFPKGPVAPDARIMLAEARYGQKNYTGAIAAYTLAWAEGGSHRELTERGLLHAAQSASELKDWARCVELLDRMQREFPRSCWAAEASCLRGWALYQQQAWDASQQEFETVAAGNDKVLRARARFMIGEIHFARKQYDKAVRAFFEVAYGDDEVAAPEPVRPWQAESLFEAARCLEQTERFDSARKLYRELVERFPESEKAQHARVSLEELKTRRR